MELEVVWWILVGSDRVEVDDFGVACSSISGGSRPGSTQEKRRRGKESGRGSWVSFGE
jgi:hypothetical protein